MQKHILDFFFESKIILFILRDQFGRIYTDILAIDAIFFQYPEKQFEEGKVVREIKKCYSGFKINNTSKISDQNKFPAISTGLIFFFIRLVVLKSVFKFFIQELGMWCVQRR